TAFNAATFSPVTCAKGRKPGCGERPVATASAASRFAASSPGGGRWARSGTAGVLHAPPLLREPCPASPPPAAGATLVVALAPARLRIRAGCAQSGRPQGSPLHFAGNRATRAPARGTQSRCEIVALAPHWNRTVGAGRRRVSGEIYDARP